MGFNTAYGDEYQTVLNAAAPIDGLWKTTPTVAWMWGARGNDIYMTRLTFNIVGVRTVVLTVTDVDVPSELISLWTWVASPVVRGPGGRQ
jgi:hypothetical protein